MIFFFIFSNMRCVLALSPCGSDALTAQTLSQFCCYALSVVEVWFNGTVVALLSPSGFNKKGLLLNKLHILVRQNFHCSTYLVVTSHFLITLGLSFSIFIGITIVGFQRNGLHFLSFLLPAGVPLPLAPFLVLLELISYCFRALSLGIRLFANMMAGHSLVKILSGFAS